VKSIAQGHELIFFPRNSIQHLKVTTSIIIILLVTGCGLDVEDATPPEAPVWVPKSAPMVWPETGIDAHESGGIVLEWYGGDEDVEKYRVYRAQDIQPADSLSDFQPIDEVLIETITDKYTYLDEITQEDVRYHYYLRARDHAENWSETSDTLDYLRLRAVSSSSMVPNGTDDTLVLSRFLKWGYSYLVAMEDYVLTILTMENDLIYRTQFTPSNYIGSRESFYLPDSVALESERTYQWRVDVHAKYVREFESSSGESPWATFTYMHEYD